MKKCIFCYVVLVAVFMTGCSRVVASSADELMMTDRCAETASGIKATLKFYDAMGEMSIYFPEEPQPVLIKGRVAVDDERFYITCEEYGKTYSFFYKVFADKAQIKYAGKTLDFYPVDKGGDFP